MGQWKMTKNGYWIIPLTILPSLIVGIILIALSGNMPTEATQGLIKLSPQGQLRLTGAIFILSPFIGFGFIYLMIGRGNLRAKRLIETGLPVTIEIIDYEETGTTVNDVPKIKFNLRVSSDKFGQYETVYHDFVSLLFLSKLKVGLKLPGKVSTENKNDLLVNFEILKKV